MILTCMDYPDPDVIRVGNTYYMVSTTMYFMPGCEILRSYDLIHWEHAAYVYDRLDSTPAQRLADGLNIYGQGMWAASIRYHNGLFYICFVANDTHKTYLYTSPDITGPWEKNHIGGFYHDNSILFDDDGRVYIVYGNRELHLTELDPEMRGPKEGGLDRVIIRDSDESPLGYEGSHIYKLNGRYYVFVINIPKGGRRTESVFVSDSLTGDFTGYKLTDDDKGYHGMGIAQGGIVDTPDGRWYAILFQDSGAVGRIPHLVPVTWNGYIPVFGDGGKIPLTVEPPDLNPGYEYAPLYGSDDFGDTDFAGEAKVSNAGPLQNTKDSFEFKSFWQFNHEPDLNLIGRDADAGTVTVRTDKLCVNVTQAANTLTQRTLYPACSARITVDASGLNEGDHAGLCMLEGEYAFCAVNRHEGRLRLVLCRRDMGDVDFWGIRNDSEAPEILEEIPLDSEVVTIGVDADFTDMKDEACFTYLKGRYGSNDRMETAGAAAGMIRFGQPVGLKFRLDHFTGARFALFVYSTLQTGGCAVFSDFVRS